MADHMIEVADGFWNIRGTFRVAGVLNVGTQSSLVRLAGGKYVLLDCCELRGDVARQVDDLTGGGLDLEAILNLHPFHTVHVQAVHERYPEAPLYGTARHRDRAPGLPWRKRTTDVPALHEQFAGDLAFSVPRGVDFISANENVHFSSVLAFHPGSGTIHSDDTFNYIGPSGLLKLAGMADRVSFHPALAKALQPRADAAAEFRAWAEGLIGAWRAAENLCAAHTAALLGRDNQGPSLHQRLLAALEAVAPTLEAHERKFG